MSTSRFLAGAVVGLVTGLLLAPQKGEDLRNDIADTAGKFKKRIDRLSGKAAIELEDLRNLLSDEISGLSDDIRYRILAILDENEAEADELRPGIILEVG